MRDNHFAVQATCLSRMRRELAVPVAPISLQRPLEQGALSLVCLPLRPKVTCQDLRSLACCDPCIPSLKPTLRE